MFFCQHSSLHLPTALRSPTFCSLHVPTVRACCRCKMSNWEKCSRKQKSFDRWCTAQFVHGAKAALMCQLFASGALLAWILGHLSEQLGKLLFCLDLPLLVNLFHTPFNRMFIQTHDTCVSPMWFPVDRSPCHLSVGASSAGHPPFDPCQCAAVQYTDWDGTIRKNTRPSTHR